jgi:DNA-binding transcriptional regulator PaaX
MRLGATQRDVLFILVALELKGRDKPFSAIELLKLINMNKGNPIHGNNLRDGCHKLVANGLIMKFRCSSTLQLAFKLSEKGRELAKAIYDERTTSDAA